MKDIQIENDIIYITVTQRNSLKHIIILDLHIWNEYKEYNICVSQRRKKFYVAILDSNRVLHLIHRVILDAPNHLQVDHINGNTLDNRLQNLRLCTNSENHQNKQTVLTKSGIRGVSWHKVANKWQTHVKIGEVRHYLGLYNTVEDAEDAVITFRSINMPFSSDAKTTFEEATSA